jgi:hypothetical protein
MEREKFKTCNIPFQIAVNVLKQMADDRYGDGEHKFTRNAKFNQVRGKINITKKLQAGAKYKLAEVSGARILKFLDKYLELMDGIDEKTLFARFGLDI